MLRFNFIIDICLFPLNHAVPGTSRRWWRHLRVVRSRQGPTRGHQQTARSAGGPLWCWRWAGPWHAGHHLSLRGTFHWWVCIVKRGYKLNIFYYLTLVYNILYRGMCYVHWKEYAVDVRRVPSEDFCGDCKNWQKIEHICTDLCKRGVILFLSWTHKLVVRLVGVIFLTIPL